MNDKSTETPANQSVADERNSMQQTSQDGPDNGANTAQTSSPETDKVGGSAETHPNAFRRCWPKFKRNPSTVRCRYVFGALIVLVLVLIAMLYIVPSAAFVIFLAFTYMMLALALWHLREENPVKPDANIDQETVALYRLKAMIAILAMITLLGVASLITYGMTLPNPDGQRQDNTNNPPVPGQPSMAMGPIIGTLVCPTPVEKPVETPGPKQPSPSEQTKSTPNRSN